jgi:ComF family protein
LGGCNTHPAKLDLPDVRLEWEKEREVEMKDLLIKNRYQNQNQNRSLKYLKMRAGQVLRCCSDYLIGLVFPDWCVICNDEPAAREDGYIGSKCMKGIQRIPSPSCPGCASAFPQFEMWSQDSFDRACDPRHSVTLGYCPECSNQRTPPSYESVSAAVYAEGSIREALLQFKYHGSQSSLLLFEKLLLERIELVRQQYQLSWDFITFPPLHPVKERDRGFNQARILAQGVAKSLKVPLLSRALKRTRPTPTQTKLGRSARLKNMRGAFQGNVKAGSSVDGANILLVDDIFTTGATSEACASELKKLGARSVDVLCLARKSRLIRQYIAVNSLKSFADSEYSSDRQR